MKLALLRYVSRSVACDQEIMNRWSDNCSGQFKSRKTLVVQASVTVLDEDNSDIRVAWDLLEANEAKNESDTIEGFSKTA